MSAAWCRPREGCRRFGLKGPRAAETLVALGLAVPFRPNTWAPLHAHDRDDSPNVIGRLGSTEFFVEESGDAPGIVALERRVAAGEPGVYPVLREDAAFVMGGRGAPQALAEVCNVDFAALAPPQLVMTLMIGVGVLALPQSVDGGTIYRIWCDPSFGPYLETVLGRTQ